MKKAFKISAKVKKARSLSNKPSKACRPWCHAEFVALLRRYAERGYLEAQTALDAMCKRGFGLPEYYKEAAKMFGFGAKQGDVIAQLILGIIF